MRDPVGKLLLFGATGDLAQRMLLPSLYGLHADGLLPEGLTITGTARSDHDDASYRKFAKHALEEFLPEDRKDDKAIKTFLERVGYQALDASKVEGFPRLAERSAMSRAASPSSCRPRRACSNRRSRASNGAASPGRGRPDRAREAARLRSRLEPRDQRRGRRSPSPRIASSGSTIISARRPSRTFSRCASATRLFEPVWNAQGIDNVQITVAETVGLGGPRRLLRRPARCATWSANHILQLLALIAMEPPARFDGTAIRDEKAKVFRSLRKMTPEEVPQRHRDRPIRPGRGRRRDREGLYRRTRQAVDHRDLRRDQGACR